MNDVKDLNIDLLAEMLLRSRELAVDGSLDQVLPALDAALFITGRAIAERHENEIWTHFTSHSPLN